jgi:ABC-type spermidine/putrescine transport system permease subunit II
MARQVNRISPFNITALALGTAFLYLPIVILVIYSFNASRLVTVWGGWSLRWYYEFFNDRAMLDAAWMSLRVAAVSATIATLLGTLAIRIYSEVRLGVKPEINAICTMVIALIAVVIVIASLASKLSSSQGESAAPL